MKLNFTLYRTILILFSFSFVAEIYAEIPNEMENWMLGGFIRPKENPIITADPNSVFYCPMNKKNVKWEESDTFNPAAVVKDGKMCILYRAEDNSAVGIGSRVSRVALAETTDGVTITKQSAPVLFPADDNNKEYEWPGGCEDPRVAVTEDGTFVIFYTAWNRDVARLCVATSKDLITWEKHGPAFSKAYGGKYLNTWSKAASIVTEIKGDNQFIAKVNGKYFMYWGEYRTHAAVSDNLKDWTPIESNNGSLLVLADVRKGYFDSDLVECGPPAVITDKGILLLYNGKNKTNDERDYRFSPGVYSAGQMLFDLNDPCKLLERTDVPFFRPMEDFEKSGQYTDGTVFIEGLTYYKKKWYLYYGCADSMVGVAIYDPENPVNGDPIPEYPSPNGIAGYPLFGVGKQVASIHSSSGETNGGESAFNLLYTHMFPDKKWCEDKNEKPWVVFELTDYYNIERFVFRDACTKEQGNGNVPEYWIYASTTSVENGDWVEVVHRKNRGSFDVKDETFEIPIEARYLKLVVSRGIRKDNGEKENAIRLYGVDIYGEISRTIDRGNLISVGKSILYYSDPKNTYQWGLNILDGNKSNPANSWNLDKPSIGSVFAIVDLERTYEIDKFMIYDSQMLGTEYRNVSGYKIYLSSEAPDLTKISSNDDQNTIWTNVVNRGSGKGNENIKTETIEAVSGRYVKLEIPRSNISNSMSFYQFEVFKKDKGASLDGKDNAVKIYPSVLKSGEDLHISNFSDGTLNILNSNGLVVFSKNIQGSECVLPISLQPGVYFLKLNSSEFMYNDVNKIIINK